MEYKRKGNVDTRRQILKKKFLEWSPGLQFFLSILMVKDRPIEAIILFLGTHCTLWYLVAKLNNATIMSLALAIYLMFMWFLDAVSVPIPWEKLNKKYSKSSTYETLILELLDLYLKLERNWEDIQSLRRENLPKFTIRATAVLLFIAYLCSFFSDFVLLYIAIFGMLLFPLLYFNSIRKKIFDYFTTHFVAAYELVSINDQMRTEYEDEDSGQDSYDSEESLDELLVDRDIELPYTDEDAIFEDLNWGSTDESNEEKSSERTKIDESNIDETKDTDININQENKIVSEVSNNVMEEEENSTGEIWESSLELTSNESDE